MGLRFLPFKKVVKDQLYDITKNGVINIERKLTSKIDIKEIVYD